MDYWTPRTLKEALSLAEENPKGVFIAGGTDLSILLFEGLKDLQGLIDITRIEELKEIRQTDGYLDLGAAVTMRSIMKDVRIPECLKGGASRVGSPQIRSIATVGGNICNASPCGDTLPGLLVLEAEFFLVSPSGERMVKAGDFFTGPKRTVLQPGELLALIRLPLSSLTGYSGFSKIGKRRGQVISQANAALRFVVDETRGALVDLWIAAGSVAPVPVRLKELETACRGKAIDSDMKEFIREKAGEWISPISDVRASEWYRRGVMGSLIVNALESAVNESGKPLGGTA